MNKMLSLKAIVANEIDKTSGQATIYLVEEDSQTLLPIAVDSHSADSVLLAQQNVVLPRPHTHDLVKRVVSALGGKVCDVVIYDLQEEIFYAYLRITHKGKLLEIDTRPSDAIALALRFAVPILADEKVIKKGGIKITDNF